MLKALKNKKLFIQIFCGALLFFMVWEAPKLKIIDSILKNQPLAFEYSHISGSLGELVLHNVVPKKANAVTIPNLKVSPSYISLFIGNIKADISANISGGEINGNINKGIFSKILSLNLDFNNINIHPQKELLSKTVFKHYLDGANGIISGNINGELASNSWINKSNKIQLTFNLSETEIALKDLGVLQAGDINGTLSMQDGALFADIHTLDGDDKSFKFELDGRSALSPNLKNSGIAGNVKVSFLGGNETNKIIFGSIGKPRLRPAKN